MSDLELPAPVFGPDRPLARERAISEYRNAYAAFQERCHGWSDYDCKTTRARYNRAVAVLEQYHLSPADLEATR